MEKIVNRLTQNSTWRGLILLTAAVSSAIQPEHSAAILTTALGLVGAINVVRNS